MSESPSPTTVTAAPNVHISSHPVLSDKISILRSSATKSSAFRSALRELTFHLGYEATANLETKPITLTVPVGHDHVECTGKKIKNQVALVPILRSGLGMVDAMLELVPNAAVHHIGMYRRDKMPVQYYNRLPKKCDADVAFIVDPLIATSNTVMSVIGILKKWGVEKIHVVAVIGSEEGINAISKAHPDVTITVGTIDKELTPDGIVLPGIGDCGDRMFGTPLIEDDEEELMHPTKRRKSTIDETSGHGV